MNQWRVRRRGEYRWIDRTPEAVKATWPKYTVEEMQEMWMDAFREARAGLADSLFTPLKKPT